ncbi:MAG: Hsp20/alpha crystallin family protein [Anaerolineales bacterium]
MTDESKALETQKQEIVAQDETERTRECPCYIPRSDIYETENGIVVVADMPGVDKSTLDITLEKDVLTISGFVDPYQPEGYSLVFAEYEVGDYQRSFRVSDEIDRDGIEASLKDGVLRLYLPKAEEVKTRKIAVKST